MSEGIFIEGARYISARDATEFSDLTRDYIARLCRTGKIRGERIGRNWYVDENRLKEFLILQKHAHAVRGRDIAIQRIREYSAPARTMMGRSAAAAAALPANAVQLQEQVVHSAARHSETLIRAARLAATQSGVTEAMFRAASHSGMSHTTFYTVTSFTDLLHRVMALITALTITFGTYALLNPSYVSFAAEHAHDTARSITHMVRNDAMSGRDIVHAIQSQVAAVAENPRSVADYIADAIHD